MNQRNHMHKHLFTLNLLQNNHLNPIRFRFALYVILILQWNME